jgi:hypothetical protein
MIALLAAFFMVAPVWAYDPSVETVKIDNQTYYVFGDMLVDIPAKAPRILGAKPLKVELWPEGIIPFEFAKNVPANVQQAVIEACRTWAQHADIKCIRGRHNNKRVYVSRDGIGGVGGGCFATLGYAPYFLGIARRMNLDADCWDLRLILHEVGHILGLTHEHQRPDRDNYVQIIEKNIASGFFGLGAKLNFEKQEAKLFTPYDFLSITHYSRNTFSKKPKLDIIRPQKKYMDYYCYMGLMEELSHGDKASVAALYGPAKNPPPIAENGKEPIRSLPGNVDYALSRQRCLEAKAETSHALARPRSAPF